VLIPGVVGTWKCNICKPQLLDTPQTLHLTGPDKKRLQVAYGNMPVQGIMDISGRLHGLLFIQMTLKNLDLAVVNNFLYNSLAYVDLQSSMMFLSKYVVFLPKYIVFLSKHVVDS
jgi:hypothetical protein